jgi:hypothetical protein
MSRTAIREARRPREGGVSSADWGEGSGRMVERAWWGVLAEMWCHVREYASLVWKRLWLEDWLDVDYWVSY